MCIRDRVKDFIQNHLFDKAVDLDNLNTFRNLSETEATRTIQVTFKEQINKLTIQDHGTSEIKDYIKLRNTRPFVANEQAFLPAKKSVFNKIIGDSHLELEFAAFLEGCEDIVSYAKNYMAVGFKIDYVNSRGEISLSLLQISGTTKTYYHSYSLFFLKKKTNKAYDHNLFLYSHTSSSSS